MFTTSFSSSRPLASDRPDAALDRVLRRAVLTGLVLVLLVPLARASTEALGWLPLWLVGMRRRPVACGCAPADWPGWPDLRHGVASGPCASVTCS